MSFFEWILSLFSFSGNMEDLSHKKMKRRVARIIKKNRYSKFYNPSSKLLQPAFATFFYTLYQYARPFGDAALVKKNGPQFKERAIRYFFNTSQNEAMEKIERDYIKEQSEKLSPKLLRQVMEKNTDAAKALFTPAWMEKVNRYYSLALSFSHFVSFDFYGMLHFFDPYLKSADYFSKTSFSKIRSITVIEYIKDFLVLLEDINIKQDWHIVFDLLSPFKIKMSDYDTWIKIVQEAQQVYVSKILEYIVKDTEGNPSWETIRLLSHEDITSAYIKEIMRSVGPIVEAVLEENRSVYMETVMQELFGNNELTVSQYNKENSALYENYGFEGFIFVDKIIFAYNFLYTYYESIKQICDIFIISGEWSAEQPYTTLSQAFGEMNSVYYELKTFYTDMSAEGALHLKAKKSFLKMKHEQFYKESLRKTISTINYHAGNIITTLMNALKKMDEIITTLDLEQKTQQLKTIINWKILGEALTKTGMELSVCGKKIHDFILLIERDVSLQDAPQKIPSLPASSPDARLTGGRGG